MAPSLEPSLNLAWVLLTGFLVMFMQAGFAMVETGFTRARSAANTMAMNLIIYPVGVLGFWLVGYGLMMGGVREWTTLGAAAPGGHELALTLGGRAWGLAGAARFALVTVASEPSHLAMFLFATVFMDTAATIPTGAMAERWRFAAFLVYGVFMSTLLYPLYGNWVWGGGWLAQLGVNVGLGHGHVDFAGSSVVHMTGGLTALAGAIVLGPRLGRFRADGTIGAMPGHNLPMSVVGTLILAFGWFGFNAGSTLSAASPRIALIAVNTMLSSAGGALAALLSVWFTLDKPDVGMACNGLLGGLVAITAGCAFVTPAAAVLVGVVAGVLVVWSVGLLERRLRVDDPVGAFAVHGVCGTWGALAVGLLADGSWGNGWNGVAGPVRGLLFGDAGQLGAQLVGVLANATFVFGTSYGFFRLVDRLVGNRVSAEVEQQGVDALEMGTDAYPRT
ncbi:ammonium transporter [Anaeromyxobacter oryzae]|uniref:Ammonium transporter n=1 Tax=Anaeromyxobacter oryzae TaxID=2918170 RepID=A0ABM7WYH7_9BACT|nr:ammonium transporter [Anaeromyxobacter oryzae]BDG04566.1 ammonium transporter [Anaeromyxobacter oryzae]